jgi:hypothetical protein
MQREPLSTKDHHESDPEDGERSRFSDEFTQVKLETILNWDGEANEAR